MTPGTGPIYRINTQRTVIRCWNPEDAPIMKASIDENISHLVTFMPWAAQEPQDLDEKIKLLRTFRGRFDLDQDFIYGIFNPGETQVIGGTGLHPRAGANAREIGYWIHHDYINQGLATEVSAALTRVAFELLEIQRVEIHCAVENSASAAVPRKLGYTQEAILRQRMLLPDNRYHDEMVWTLLRDEYPSTPSAQAALEAFDAMGRLVLSTF
jgi:RimJ/RimL family protein N-acetyltransferase